VRFRMLAVIVALFATVAVAPLPSPQAASAFASLAFEMQWKAGEAITPNFWGPLANASGAREEVYAESTAGSRTVQYFDKGRMEARGDGSVTNGLLATELVKGQMQVGDATFQAKTPPAIAIAGDATNTGATYVAIATTAKALLIPATNKTDTRLTQGVAPDGTIITGNAPNSTGTMLMAYDATTQHNVTLAFARYRDRASLAAIGFAISEPFFATVPVSGQAKDVVIQVFERRVLTYTATNPEAFQVEMGNIGQHYYQWRYGSGNAAPLVGTTTNPATPTVTLTPTETRTAPPAASPTTVAIATATTTIAAGAAPSVSFANITSPVGHGAYATASVKTAPGANCSITVTYKSGASEAAGLTAKSADAGGMVMWTWKVGTNTMLGSWPVDVSCATGGKSGAARTYLVVT